LKSCLLVCLPGRPAILVWPPRHRPCHGGEMRTIWLREGFRQSHVTWSTVQCVFLKLKAPDGSIRQASSQMKCSGSRSLRMTTFIARSSLAGILCTVTVSPNRLNLTPPPRHSATTTFVGQSQTLNRLFGFLSPIAECCAGDSRCRNN
jgi:hypothetical protein